MNARAEAAPGGGRTKISCRNVWKVYGREPDRFFTGREGEVEAPEALYVASSPPATSGPPAT